MKKLLKFYILLPLCVVLLVTYLFGGWQLAGQKKLTIWVIDKTVPAGKLDRYNTQADDYRKHQGFFWLLSQQRYSNAQGKPYDYKTDYYGSQLDTLRSVTQNKLTEKAEIPQLIYMADATGSLEGSAYSGITLEDMALLSTAYNRGSLLVGEFNCTAPPTPADVVAELENLFGYRDAGWSGRFVKELGNKNDLPSWALARYQQQNGRPWDLSGEGMLLVSQAGELVVLQKGIDYTDTPLTLAVNDAYKSEYGSLSAPFYNWFQLTQAQYGTDVLASYTFHVNSTGRQKCAALSASITFPAVTLKTGVSEAYYFCGDFSDYTPQDKSYAFLGAPDFYSFFSFNRPGDSALFYWRFYTPLMEKLLQKAQAVTISPPAPVTAGARLTSAGFQVPAKEGWQAITVKAFAFAAEEPGKGRGEYSRSLTYYKSWIQNAAGLNANCLLVYDLLPPEFYRALWEYNRANENKVYLLQSVCPQTPLSAADFSGQTAARALKQRAQDAVNALRGKAALTVGGQEYHYYNDVTGYLLGFLANLNISAETAQALGGLAGYSGAYLSGEGAAGQLALFADALLSAQAAYGTPVPVGGQARPELLGGEWNANIPLLNPDSLITTAKGAGLYFNAVSLRLSDALFQGLTAPVYQDDQGIYPFGQYLHAVRELLVNYPALVCFSAPTFTAPDTKGLSFSEEEQGPALVRMCRAAKTEGYVAGVIADLCDSWLGTEQEGQTVPLSDDGLWYNALEAGENTGLFAVTPEGGTTPLVLADTGFLRQLEISQDEGYLYLTLQLSAEVDFDTQQLFVGLDTYQRNNGEYLYNPLFFANSLSGMEFVLAFESRSSASLYVTPSYNAAQGQYASKETYTGMFQHLLTLHYGNFGQAGTQFYQTGSTLHVRLPWALLNVTDPARGLVISDERSRDEIQADPFGLQTRKTDGFMVSLFLGDKKTSDTLYLFPINKQAAGYKLFSWQTYTTAHYGIRPKQGAGIIAEFFKNG